MLVLEMHFPLLPAMKRVTSYSIRGPSYILQHHATPHRPSNFRTFLLISACAQKLLSNRCLSDSCLYDVCDCEWRHGVYCTYMFILQN